LTLKKIIQLHLQYMQGWLPSAEALQLPCMPETRTCIPDIFLRLVLVIETLLEAVSASKTLWFFNQNNTTEKSCTHISLI
jgi:hypothetical protein